MGTHRFQMLYRSLAKDEGATNSMADTTVPWPREASLVLPEELDKVFLNPDSGGPDMSGLIPLVAKLVACENSYFS